MFSMSEHGWGRGLRGQFIKGVMSILWVEKLHMPFITAIVGESVLMSLGKVNQQTDSVKLNGRVL